MVAHLRQSGGALLFLLGSYTFGGSKAGLGSREQKTAAHVVSDVTANSRGLNVRPERVVISDGFRRSAVVRNPTAATKCEGGQGCRE